jgi:3-oxoacyl-[acyl-carrier protein] reductase/bacilysin biosynthesis oxidoreductase BacG
MNLGLENKVILIVGGSRGIGAAAARLFAQEGAKVALVSRGRADLERLADELHNAQPESELLTFSRDATEPASAEFVIGEVVRRMGRLDVLVNNAGAGLRRPFEQLSDADWSASIELNLMTSIRFSRAALPEMKTQGGRIINIAAVSGVRPRQGQMASNVAKAGLVNFTRSLALETAPYNILVNAVCPGHVDSPRWRARFEAQARELGKPADDLMRDTVGKTVPLGRPGAPGEAAGIIVFLAGAPASYITGAVIHVDGGFDAGFMLE